MVDGCWRASEDIGDGRDSPFEWNIFALEPDRVPVAVPSLEDDESACIREAIASSGERGTSRMYEPI